MSLLWEGQLIRGSHEPVVSLDEFKAVQAAIRRPTAPRPKRHSFAYTGLIRCGECGMAVTAQRNTNRFGSQYVYYRCTRKGLQQTCRQPAIREEELERQIIAWLAAQPAGSEAEIKIATAFNAIRQRASATAHAIRQSVASALKEAQAQIAELTHLRLRRFIGDDEFASRRSDLQLDAERLARKLNELNEPEDWLKPYEAALPLAFNSTEWFRRADAGLRRTILKSVGSNLTLLDRKISVEAAKWLRLLYFLLGNPTLLRD